MKKGNLCQKKELVLPFHNIPPPNLVLEKKNLDLVQIQVQKCYTSLNPSFFFFMVYVWLVPM